MARKYQGPVPEGYDEAKFRKTGITEKLVKEKLKASILSKKLKERITSRPILREQKRATITIHTQPLRSMFYRQGA